MCIHSVEKCALMFEKVEDLQCFKFFVYLFFGLIKWHRAGCLSLKTLGQGLQKRMLTLSLCTCNFIYLVLDLSCA